MLQNTTGRRLTDSGRDSPPPQRRARASLPATCGELVQGTLGGQPCLVSCPIGRYSLAEVQLDAGSGWKTPDNAPKSTAAIQAGLAYVGRPDLGGQLRLVSDLPRSRGYGSSTADVGAALYALGLAVQRPLEAVEVARLAVDVEPTDGTLFPGLALFNHRQGGQHCDLGPAPHLLVFVIDPGGSVDTQDFNRLEHRRLLRRVRSQHQQAFDMLFRGLERHDWRQLGEAATLSSRIHQAILPNPLLDFALQLARQVHALGVCRAHSGTLLGLLLDPYQADVAAVSGFVTSRLPAGVQAACYPMVDGGPRPGPGPARSLERS